MWWEINVSHYGTLLFRTDRMSFHTKELAEEGYAILSQKFPERHGYKVEMYLWQLSGKLVRC